MRNTFINGQWNAICDICGLERKSGRLTKNWRGLMVCRDTCYETRNPQDLIKVRGEHPAPPWTRPENPVMYLPSVCYLWDESGYAGLATSGCMIAGNQQFTPQFLLNLKQGS